YRRAQPDRRPGGGAVHLCVRQEDFVIGRDRPLFIAGAGFAGATGESRCYPAMIFCSAAAAAENLFHADEGARATRENRDSATPRGRFRWVSGEPELPSQ